MTAEVERRAAARGLTNVAVDCRDAENLGDGSFDVALCSLGLMYVPDPVAAARELRRVVRRGGRVVVSVWGERRNCGWAELFPIVDARVSSDVCPMFFALGSPGALTETFEQAGFADVDETTAERRVALRHAPTTRSVPPSSADPSPSPTHGSTTTPVDRRTPSTSSRSPTSPTDRATGCRANSSSPRPASTRRERQP